jgi:ATP-dependent Lhr-like helicase
MALAIQEEGIPRADWWAWVSSATAFTGLTADDRAELLAHMLDESILHEDGGRLGLGERGQRLYGAKHFAELYTVFSAPRTLTVMHGHEAVGQIDAYFAQTSDFAKLSFTLAARSWQATSIDWNRRVIHVRPIEAGGLPRWQGQPVLLSRALCEAIRGVLAGTNEPDTWSQRAVRQLALIRTEYEFLSETGPTLVAEGSGCRLWTFYGGRANNLLAKVLESRLGAKVVNNNLYIGFKDGAGESEVAIREALDTLRAEGKPDQSDAVRFAESCARGRLSKFEPCLSDRLLSEYLAEELTELPI